MLLKKKKKSFLSDCRSCIIYRLKNGPKTCPACDTLVVARPRADNALQRLIYLVVPSLYKSELERRRNFRLPIPNFQNDTETVPSVLQGALELGFEDLVSLSLCRVDMPAPTRYLKCPAGVTVRHLQRLMMLKRGWQDDSQTTQQSCNVKIEMMHEIVESDTTIVTENLEPKFELLDPAWTLVDISCIFKWSRVKR